MRTIIVTILTVALASCAPMGLQQAESKPFGSNRLVDTLAGRAAGSPLTCLPSGRQWRSQTLHGGGMLYRSGGQTYVGTFQGGCPDYGRFGVVATTRGNSMCAGDAVELRDTVTRRNLGLCVIGPFMPYGIGSKLR